MQYISCSELDKLPEQEQTFRVIDVRSNDEWDAGYIDHAELFPLSLIPLLASERLPDKEDFLVLYCAVGGRAVLAATELENMGYENVKVLEGGYCNWKQLNSNK